MGGGGVQAFLTPNIHRVRELTIDRELSFTVENIKPQSVDVLSKMHVKIDGGIKFHGDSNGSDKIKFTTTIHHALY